MAMSSSLPPQIVDPASADAWSEYVRQRITPDLDPSHQITPDEVIAELQNVRAAAGRMALVVKESDRIRRRTARILVRAQAKAQREAKAEGGRVADIAARVSEMTEAEDDAADDADAAHQYAKSVSRLVDEQKSSIQTIARLVELMYATAGRRGA